MADIRGQMTDDGGQMADDGHQWTEGGGRQSNFTAGGTFPTNLNEFHECSRRRTLRKAFCPRIYANLPEHPC